MKQLPWNAATAAALELEWLLTESAPAGEFGRRFRAQQRAFGPGDEAEARVAVAAVARVGGAASIGMLEALRGALAAVPDPSTALARAAAGDVLGDVDFFDLNRFLDALGEVRALLADAAFAGVEAPAGDASLAAALAPGRTPQRSFYLDDAFAPELASARAAANERQTAYDAARGRLTARVALALGLPHVRDGEFTLMRDALGGPLPPEVRVLREAPTYLACELALDDATLAALAARDAAAVRVAELEEAVRARLSRVAGEAAPALLRACAALGELDAFAGRARFARRYACVEPSSFRQCTWIIEAPAARQRAAVSPNCTGVIGRCGVCSGNSSAPTAATVTIKGCTPRPSRREPALPCRSASARAFEAHGGDAARGKHSTTIPSCAGGQSERLSSARARATTSASRPRTSASASASPPTVSSSSPAISR